MEGKISINRMVSNEKEYYPIRIEIEDSNAGITFIVIGMTLDNFANCITGLSGVECEIETRGLENVGKTIERSKIEFLIPGEFASYKTEKEELYKLAVENCPPGWKVVGYFGSRDSVFTKEGKKYGRAQIVRWIDK